MAVRKRTASKIYELYVELGDIEPLICRRLLVPATILAMGWTNSHLHCFFEGQLRQAISMTSDDNRALSSAAAISSADTRPARPPFLLLPSRPVLRADSSVARFRLAARLQLVKLGKDPATKAAYKVRA